MHSKEQPPTTSHITFFPVVSTIPSTQTIQTFWCRTRTTPTLMLRSQLASPTLFHALDAAASSHGAQNVGRQLQRATHGLGFGDAVAYPGTSPLRSPFRTPGSPILGSSISGGLDPGSLTIATPCSPRERLSMVGAAVSTAFTSPRSPRMLSPSASVEHSSLSPRLLFPATTKLSHVASPLARRQSLDSLDCNGTFDTSREEENGNHSAITRQLVELSDPPSGALRQKPVLSLDVDFLNTFGPFVSAPPIPEDSEAPESFSALPQPSPFTPVARASISSRRRITFTLDLPKRTGFEDSARSQRLIHPKTPYPKEADAEARVQARKVSFTEAVNIRTSPLTGTLASKDRPKTPFPRADNAHVRSVSLGVKRNVSIGSRKVSFATIEEIGNSFTTPSNMGKRPPTPYRTSAPGMTSEDVTPTSTAITPTNKASFLGVREQATGPSVPSTFAQGRQGQVDAVRRATVAIAEGLSGTNKLASPSLPPRASTLATPTHGSPSMLSSSVGRPRAAEAIFKLSHSPAPRKFSFSNSPLLAGSPRFTNASVIPQGTLPSLVGSPLLASSPMMGAAARKAVVGRTKEARQPIHSTKGKAAPTRKLSLSETPFRGITATLPSMRTPPILSSTSVGTIGGRRVASLFVDSGMHHKTRKVSFSDTDARLGIKDTKLRARPLTPFREVPTSSTPATSGRRCGSFADAPVRTDIGSYFPLLRGNAQREGSALKQATTMVVSPDEIVAGAEGKEEDDVPGLALVDAKGVEGKIRTWSEAQDDWKNVEERVPTPFVW